MHEKILLDGIDLYGLVVALGGGLLVGLERERRRAWDTGLAGGLRTSMLAALIGALGVLLGPVAAALCTVLVGACVIAGGWPLRHRHRTLTAEFALFATFLLGALAIGHAQLAAALFVVLTALLAGKETLHRFSREVLGEQDLDDILLLAAACLIVLPLLPDRVVGPYGVLNPHELGLLVIWVMAVGAVGYVGLRLFGARRGLVLAGVFGGFVSSTATIAGMGQRARADPALTRSCIAAALASNVATLVQLALILALVSPASLVALAWPLLGAALTTMLVCAAAMWHANGGAADAGTAQDYGRPFVLSHALAFAAIVAVALLGAAALQDWLGPRGAFAAAAFGGFADVHAATLAVGQLAATATLTPLQAAQAIAVAFTANAAFRCFAALSGGRAFGRPVAAGLIAVNVVLLLMLSLEPPRF
jgi:uncharacterized membrane protein (DUF4010 family)